MTCCWRMTLFRLSFFWPSVVLVLFLYGGPSEAQVEDKNTCMNKFIHGKDDFVLKTNESVKEGATFLGSPQVSRPEDCVMACCKDPNCNLALMEEAGDSSTINTCFIFNCLYKQKRVCQFVKKPRYSNYLLKSVFDDYLEQQGSDEEDKPPIAFVGQDKVVQPQEDVTLNGIESRDDKKIVKYEWEMLFEDPSVVMTKTNFPDAVTISNLSPGMYKFRLTVTDEAGQTDSAEISVLVLTPEQSLHHCLVPKKEGPCRGSFPRWHYNAASQKCEVFKFGGCKPNRNNYLTFNECNNACDKVSVSTHSGRLGPIPGEKCDEACGSEQFMCSNNCCIDKDLECDGETQCSDGSDESQCSNLNNKFTRLIQVPVDNSKAHCVDPPVTGICRASFTKWYYNPYERSCKRFTFGGCEGNNNRFDTEDQCMESCRSVTESDVFERRAAFERLEGGSDQVAIVIAVLLGIGIAILLIVLICCLLKGKKKGRNKHQTVAVNGGHTYDYSEKLVYNSTTKPI